MSVVSPVSERLTVVSLLLLTFATGIVDAVSVLALGHVFVANMTGNIIFLGFWFVPHSGIDLTAAIVAFVSFVAGAVLGGRLARHIDREVRLWLTVALGVEVVVLLTLSSLAGAGVLNYHDNTKLILTAGLAVTFGSQNATARQFGVQELSTTVLTSTIVGLGFDSRLAGGTGHREKLRYSVVVTMCAGAVVGATITRFTQAVLPRLRKSRGRVVFISSVNGRLSMPLIGAYAASKFALEAAADALRMELRPWHIGVAIVEPAQTDTDMWRTANDMVEQTESSLTPEQRDLYAKHIAGMKKMIPLSQKMAVPTEKVSAVVEEALTARRPRARYVVGVGPKLQVALMTNLPAWARDRVLRRVAGQP